MSNGINNNDTLSSILRFLKAIILSVVSFFLWVIIVLCIPILRLSSYGFFLAIPIAIVVFIKCYVNKPKYNQTFDYPEYKLEGKVYTEKQQRNPGDFLDKSMNWIRGNKVTAAMAMSLIVISIVLISIVSSANPSPKSIGKKYVKEYEQETELDIRIKDIQYRDENRAYIILEYYDGLRKTWDDYDSITVTKKFGKWEAQ